jgi:hypothetical protein
MGDEKNFMSSVERGHGGFGRSLPKIDDLQRNSDLARFLGGVLASGKSIDTLDSNAALDRCYKKGWLQAEMLPNRRRVYVFPSKLHER